MKYVTGTYIMRTAKVWNCSACNRTIIKGSKCFVRVREYGKTLINKEGETYRHKDYKRYHISCSKNLDNLNDYETKLITNYENQIPNHCKKEVWSSEKQLRINILYKLKELENQKKLTYLPLVNGQFKDNNNHIVTVGRRGFPDIIVFTPNNTLFIELKLNNKRNLAPIQKIIKEKLEFFGNSYYIVSSTKELITILNTNI